ncbi:hypothetical protein [Saccharothrix stipae]
MTILLPIPRNLAFIASLGLLDKFRGFLAARLTRTPSRARHRVLSPGQIRWQRWKFVVAHHLSPTTPAGPAPRPSTPVQPRVQAFLAPRWSALHPPPRTAQSTVPAEAVTVRWTVPPALAATRALSSAEPEVWPEAWPEVWPEVRPEQVDNCFTGHLDDLAAAEPSVGRHRLRKPVTLRYLADAIAESRAPVGPAASDEPAHDEPVYNERVYDQPVYDQPVYDQPVYDQPVYDQPVYDQPAYDQPVYYGEPVVAEPEPAEPAADEPAAAEPLVWEFRPGDLIDWWAAAEARLDAAARDEARSRLW